MNQFSAVSAKVDPIHPEKIQRARRISEQSSRRIIEVLEDITELTQEVFLRALGDALKYVTIDIKAIHDLKSDFDVLQFSEAYQHECIPLRNSEGDLFVVIADPFTDGLANYLLEKIREPFSFRLAHFSDVLAYLSRFEETLKAMDNVMADEEDFSKSTNYKIDGVEELSLSSISADASPVIRIVNSTLYDAMKIGASDIHLETTGTGLALKYRIDGVLDTLGDIQGAEMAEQVISRIKVMAELDIAERRIPQDGRFKVSIQNREVDLRVSIMPSVYGEDAVLRILDRKVLTEQSKGLTLEHIGIDELTRYQFRALAKEPYGMVLVTGPTGSGKTTTLYAGISEVNTGKDKIITIEDPVEYNLSGVLQIPVNEKKDSALREVCVQFCVTIRIKSW
jgi:general secretion pathway protein E